MCAAPVLVSRKVAAKSYAQAIVVNSGCANACTGEQGLKDAEAMQAQTAELLGVENDAVYVCSTGVIGHFMPMDKLAKALPMLLTLWTKPAAKAAPWQSRQRILLSSMRLMSLN